MMFPIRCFSCGAPIGHRWEEYKRRVEEGEPSGKVLDSMGFKRYCCRRMFISGVDVFNEIVEFHRRYSEYGRSQKT
ncbi:MAG TPA: DNA-directed RNA polymerase subunit N [Candidatus Caldiarchaeum subterraneum]|uniref:DNA-directed RNA polymerase subunit Rpo10 n=1 Tax=Caldiarchaeum subterraneum TaxID=311458 RepID=A0A832ZUP8_CALS0|nr:DNA-directed RNA polymerase subunit N [Candidatus Caldarchaeum subterraneum]